MILVGLPHFNRNLTPIVCSFLKGLYWHFMTNCKHGFIRRAHIHPFIHNCMNSQSSSQGIKTKATNNHTCAPSLLQFEITRKSNIRVGESQSRLWKNTNTKKKWKLNTESLQLRFKSSNLLLLGDVSIHNTLRITESEARMVSYNWKRR